MNGARQPYIAHISSSHRKAYGFSRITQRRISAETTVEAADAANIRHVAEHPLWDWRALQDTLRQIGDPHLLRLSDIDIDRYDIDGATREVMLAARRVERRQAPESSATGLTTAIYTHGYGITMKPVNGFTRKGCPR